MLKLWDRRNGFVQQESCMFTARNEVKLLFPAKEIVRIFTPAAGKEYRAGRDFEYNPGSGIIRRIPQGEMPYIPECMMHPDENAVCFPAPDARAITGACDGGRLFFNNDTFFAGNQIFVDYRTENIDFEPELLPQSDRLPLTRKKLAAGEPVKITLLGDSISEGFNATAYNRCEPFAPAYIDQVARSLNDRFRSEIILKNRAVNGTGCEYPANNPDLWVNDRPDLLIIAYGMNDFHKMPGSEFVAACIKLIEMCRKNMPECEVILVSSMTGHPNWQLTRPGRDFEFADALRDFCAGSDHSIALADVQKVWKKLLERKDFYDLSGNGVNHPNDYGHRVYASVILQLLSGIDMF